MSHKSTMFWKELTINIGTWLVGESFEKIAVKAVPAPSVGPGRHWLAWSTRACLLPVSKNFQCLKIFVFFFFIMLSSLSNIHTQTPVATSMFTLLKLQHPRWNIHAETLSRCLHFSRENTCVVLVVASSIDCLKKETSILIFSFS